ncbi:chorismate mutase [Rhodobacteraceae bacterium 2376]|uniref:chorismate mutase n=1 Tax=Rhabdonatronobacter sediminivivens TaxID=2743469 RepID=A0A7Z0KYV9_9RHOB|nr:chorismate mutase [Rhabdonatronobacter sediminivivens]NYS24906.1 chorismate mutase [Rhabdonatronobacter sediminivivens]
MKPAEDCRTMAELREQIDLLDRALIDLLVQRASYIDRAIALKPTEGLPARIEPRVAEVIANVRATAEAEGFDPDLAEDLWGRIIEWSIAREERVLGPS